MVRRLMRAGHACVVFDRSAAAVSALEKEGAVGARTLAELIRQLPQPRALCLMVPVATVDALIDEAIPLLSDGDVIIDGGNSYFHDDIARSARLARHGLQYVDMGTSGGIWGLERGYCLMIGGRADIVARLDPIFVALAPGSNAPPLPDRKQGTAPMGYLHCGPPGAGHFVKMVHNAIEYGLMAAYAEGLSVLKHADIGTKEVAADAETAPLRHPEHYQFEFDLAAITEVWRHGSVIASWLLDLTAAALAKDQSLEAFAGRVSDSGEGRWALAAANEEGVPAHVLAAALFERFASRGEGDFQNRVLSAMRFAFGGHMERS